MDATAILQPVFVLGLLTIVMTIWMFATRIPAMSRLRIDPQKAQDTIRLLDMLPPEVNRISNNYNHLFEQPTLFYAAALSVAILGHTDTVHVACAWAYVGLRVVHSLVQATVDIVMVRFTLFLLSWVALGVIVVRESLALF
jgi:hypothetical protein